MSISEDFIKTHDLSPVLTSSELCRTSRTLPELPADVVYLILQETVAMPSQLNSNINQGPNSLWMRELRFRKSLTLVCRRWWDPAARLLYRYIVLRRPGQIPALAQMLEQSSRTAGRDISALIRHITMDHLVTMSSMADVIQEGMQTILRRCTALISFTVIPHPNFYQANDENYEQEFPDGPEFSPLILSPSPKSLRDILKDRLRGGLRRLHLSMKLYFDVFDSLRHMFSDGAATNLRSLTLGADSLLVWLELGQPNEKINLPRLEDLAVHVSTNEFPEYLCSSWVLPKLRSLTILACRRLPRNVLAAFGKNLKYLHLCPKHYCHDKPGRSVTGLQNLPELCPGLEHLVFCQSGPDPLRKVVEMQGSLPQLRHIDIWRKTNVIRSRKVYSCRVRICQLEDHVKKFPLLKWRIRLLAAGMDIDSPRLCDPADTVKDGHWRIHSVRGVDVVQTSWCIMFYTDFKPRQHHPWDLDVGEDTSSSYTAGDSSDDEDRTSWVSHDASSDDEEEPRLSDDPFILPQEGLTMHPYLAGNPAYGPNELQFEYPESLGREDMLEMFEESQQGDFTLDEQADQMSLYGFEIIEP